MNKRVWLLGFTTLLVGMSALLLGAQPAAALPDGFGDRKMEDISAPTAIAFTPDGRMLIATKDGKLRVRKEGQLLDTPALNISNKVCSNSERGLLGVAVDPDFDTNGFVYLYYTYNKHGACPLKKPDSNKNPVNRISRFKMSGDTIDSSIKEKVLINNIMSPNGNHNGGDLHFGKDGYLYASVGDGGCDYANPSRCQYENGASRRPHVLLGKILRVTRDGGIPPGNPYTGDNSRRCNVDGRTTQGKNCEETFSKGLRNPFRMAFDPDAGETKFRINDVGGRRWEEIDDSKSGADYGWNICEGRHDNPDRKGFVNCSTKFTPPIHEYNHNSGCSSITGGAFVPNGAWPASYDKAYLFGDYVCGKIFSLKPRDGGGFQRTPFATDLKGGGPIHMAFGPYRGGQTLYYTTFDGSGQVRAIVHADSYPTATLKTKAEQNWSSGPTIEFDGSGSSDPQDGPLTYFWDFGDGTQKETDTPTTSHTYSQETKKYEGRLTVRDEDGLEDTDTIDVFPNNNPPEPNIESPTADSLFKVGQQVTLSGSATDAEDDGDDDPDTQPELNWQVVRHHDNNHTHPWSYGTGNDLVFTAPPPEGLLSTDPSGNYLEIKLTATDSQGLSSNTVTRPLKPKTVNVRFATRPLKLKLTVNGKSFRASRTFVSWEGYKLNVYAPSQRYNGRKYVFRRWSDGRAARHTIRTPDEMTKYIATFKRKRR